MDYYNELHELCETIKEAIGEANEKIKKAGGSLSAGDVEYIDKLTHSLKSIKAVMAMMDEEDGGEYGGSDGGSYRGGSYRGGRGGSYRYDDGMMTGGSYRGGSYARGRGSNARRDSMGRYSSRGYSRAEGDMAEIVEELKGMMSDLPEDKQREVQRFVEKVERM